MFFVYDRTSAGWSLFHMVENGARSWEVDLAPPRPETINSRFFFYTWWIFVETVHGRMFDPSEAAKVSSTRQNTTNTR